jgi:uncharacterized membrane protein
MTTLEIILISYILLNWFLGIMFVTLPKRVVNKVIYLLIIICPPLIIIFIGQGIKEELNKKKKQKEDENE